MTHNTINNEAIITDDMNYMRVVFYYDTNINTNDKISFSHGIIDPSKLIINGKNPILVRLEATTSLSIQYNNNDKIYNNPYTDRYVLIRLDLGRSPITSCQVNAYIPSIDDIDNTDNNDNKKSTKIEQSTLSRYINVFSISLVILIFIMVFFSHNTK